jgi:thymidylate kinase
MRGAFVVVVGPDGVGKSGLARSLLELAPAECGYFHFRPPIGNPLRGDVPLDESPPPKNRTRPSVPLGWVRLGVGFVRFWVGHLATVLPAVRRGSLVVGDRWAYGYLVQPRALRYGGPSRLARYAIRCLPKPDLVINLTAPVEEIHRRKQELTPGEIAAELKAWSAIPAPKMITIDARQTSRDMAARVLTELTL